MTFLDLILRCVVMSRKKCLIARKYENDNKAIDNNSNNSGSSNVGPGACPSTTLLQAAQTNVIVRYQPDLTFPATY